MKLSIQKLDRIRLAAVALLLMALTGCPEGNPKFSVPSPDNGKNPPQQEASSAPKINMEPDANFVLAQDSVQGAWQLKTVMINGSGLPGGMAESSSIEFTGDNYKVSIGGNEDGGTFAMDISQSPGKMKLTCTSGEHTGKVMDAIFEMPNAGVMKLCYDINSKGSPESFESTKENGVFSGVFVRKAQ